MSANLPEIPNRMKGIILALLVLLLWADPIAAQAQFTYTTNADDTLTITGYSGPGGAVTIPTNSHGLTVTSIGNSAFASQASLTKISIPGTITTIGADAFEYCFDLTNAAIATGTHSLGDSAFYYCWNLSSALIPDSVTNIGTNAFSRCARLTSVEIPLGITSLGASTFAYCSGLTNVIIPASVSSIGDFAFVDCTSLASVVVPDDVTNLGVAAFEGCTRLTTAPIPGNVLVIGSVAFFGCPGVTNIAIPPSVTNIGYSAFSECSRLVTITVNPLNSFYGSVNGVLFDKTQTKLVQYPSGAEGGSYTVPGGVTSVVPYSFAYCPYLTNVTIPASVNSIGPWAFNDSYGLEAISVDAQNLSYSSVNGVLFDKNQITLVEFPPGISGSYAIPDGVTSIGNDAFMDCYKPTSITIPASVTNIGDFAFYDCTGVAGVYFQGNPPMCGLYAYDFDDNATVYHLADSSGWSTTFANLPVALWNPVIQTGNASFGLRNNQFGFNITGTTNIPIVVEACTNLANPVWIPLQTLTLANGSFYFSEPFQTNTPARFYRISAP